jgi:hypothetical protein
MPIIAALGSLRQEGGEFKASLGYIARPCFKKKSHLFLLLFGVLAIKPTILSSLK